MIRFPAKAFVNALAKQAHPGFINPWSADSGTGNEERRECLIRHLTCIAPRYLFVAEKSLQEDVSLTGVPLCCEYTAGCGLIPRLKIAPRAGVPAFDPGSAELWRSLAFSMIADRSICFSTFPFLANPGGWTSIEETNAVISREIRWVKHIAAWHPQIRVIALGARTKARLDAAQIPAEASPTPSARGFSDALTAIVQENLP